MPKYIITKEFTAYEVNAGSDISKIRTHTFKVGDIVDSEMRSKDGGKTISKTPTVIVDGVEYGTLFINKNAGLVKESVNIVPVLVISIALITSIVILIKL